MGGCDFDYCGACYDFKCRMSSTHLETIAKKKEADRLAMRELVESLQHLEAEGEDTSESDEDFK